MSRGDPLVNPESARVVRPGRQHPNRDQGELYDGHDALFPKGWDDLDPGRFDATGCWASLTVTRIFHGGPVYWKATCRHCRGSWRGASEREAMSKARKAHGDEP